MGFNRLRSTYNHVYPLLFSSWFPSKQEHNYGILSRNTHPFVKTHSAVNVFRASIPLISEGPAARATASAEARWKCKIKVRFGCGLLKQYKSTDM